MRTYTVVFSREREAPDYAPDYRTILVRATSHSHMVRQVRDLVEPVGYHYIGTRDANQWYHPPVREVSL
jgi:hypothetical protein